MEKTAILFYNTHLFLDLDRPARRIVDDEVRTAAIVRSIIERRPAVAALCEVWADARVERVLEGLREHYRHHFRPATRAGFFMSSGLLLASRWPIAHADFTPYNEEGDAAHRVDMGFVLAEIARPNESALACRLVLTHNQPTFDNDVARYAVVRERNMSKVLERIEATPADGVPWIITGDLNVIAEADGRPTDEYRRLCDRLGGHRLLDMYRTLHPDPEAHVAHRGLTYDGATNPLIDAFDGAEMAGSRERIDYFWVSESSREGWQQCAIEDEAYTYVRPTGGTWPASDHYPLEATLML
jgi:exonuclease III